MKPKLSVIGVFLIATIFSLSIGCSTYNAPPPNIVIVSPENNAVVPEGNVTVTVQVGNFSLNKLGQGPVAGEGHIHYFFDIPPPTTLGEPALTAPGTYAATPDTTYSWPGVTPGVHNFSVELVNNDHTPLNPPVFQMVNITANGTPTPGPTTIPVTSTMATPVPLPVTTQTTLPSGGSVTIGLTAQNIAFNTSTISAPAGASVTIVFANMDPGVPHNLALYTDSATTINLFRGQIITGPATTTYTFIAPSTPGNYFFRCDVHPTIMYGTFAVT